jgi:hypothetical protein
MPADLRLGRSRLPVTIIPKLIVHAALRLPVVRGLSQLMRARRSVASGGSRQLTMANETEGKG